MFSYESTSNQLLNDEIGIGTATRLHLIEISDELEGTRKEDSFYLSICQLYVDCVRKIVVNFPFDDLTINDPSIILAISLKSWQHQLHNCLSTLLQQLMLY